ncbi:hypothetical protein BGZ98_003785 [Dissophora globulifera]|nr:hypothetical protein BGZ98_003785 [Dissophora globulifera]
MFDRACLLSVIDGFHKHPLTVIAQEYEDCLAKRGVEGLETQLVVDRGILNSKHVKYKGLRTEIAMRDKVLEILTKLRKFALRPSLDTENPSENDCLHLWTSAFDVIMEAISLHTFVFLGICDRVHPGGDKGISLPAKVPEFKLQEFHT